MSSAPVTINVERSSNSPETLPTQSRAGGHRTAGHLACERCRTRKIRCSGMPGPCETCVRSGAECISASIKKHREQRQLEIRLEKLESIASSFGGQSVPHKSPNVTMPQSGSSTFPNTEDYFDWEGFAQSPDGQRAAASNSGVAPTVHRNDGQVAAGSEWQPSLSEVYGVGVSPPWWQSFPFAQNEAAPAPAGNGAVGFAAVPNALPAQTLAQYIPPIIPQATHQPSASTSNAVSLSSTSTRSDTELLMSSPGITFYLGVFQQLVDHPLSWFKISEPWPGVDSQLATYARLYAAAIGALRYHKSRQKSAKYAAAAEAVRYPDLWDGLEGLQCALWNAVYRFEEDTTFFGDEMDEPPPTAIRAADKTNHNHPPNLWLRIARIIARCIDLGLTSGYLVGHNPLRTSFDNQASHEPDCEKQQYFNTFRTTCWLDANVSAIKQRPRAIRESDMDTALAAILK